MAQRTYLQQLAKLAWQFVRYVDRYQMTTNAALTTTEQAAVVAATANLRTLLEIPFRQQP